jgi:hypothetical protein
MEHIISAEQASKQANEQASKRTNEKQSHRIAIQAYESSSNDCRVSIGNESIGIDIGLRASPVQSSPSFLPNDYYYYQWQLWHPIDIGCSQMK